MSGDTPDDLEAFALAERDGYVISRTGRPEPQKQWIGRVPRYRGLWCDGDSPAAVVSSLMKITAAVRDWQTKREAEAVAYFGALAGSAERQLERGETIDVTDMSREERRKLRRP